MPDQVPAASCCPKAWVTAQLTEQLGDGPSRRSVLRRQGRPRPHGGIKTLQALRSARGRSKPCCRSSRRRRRRAALHCSSASLSGRCGRAGSHRHHGRGLACRQRRALVQPSCLPHRCRDDSWLGAGWGGGGGARVQEAADAFGAAGLERQVGALACVDALAAAHLQAQGGTRAGCMVSNPAHAGGKAFLPCRRAHSRVAAPWGVSASSGEARQHGRQLLAPPCTPKAPAARQLLSTHLWGQLQLEAPQHAHEQRRHLHFGHALAHTVAGACAAGAGSMACVNNSQWGTAPWDRSACMRSCSMVVGRISAARGAAGRSGT